MIYRISQRSLFRNINTNLGFLSWDMARVNNQIATGKRVNKPSDDPTGGSLILSMRTVLAGVEQYNKDVAIADDWLSQTESVIQNMKLAVERATVLAEQMATDTYDDDNMDVASQEVEELLSSLIKMGNTRIGDRYLLAGRKTDVQPFRDVLTIWDALKDSGNSSSYTGKMLPPGSRDYEHRPDIPVQTKQYVAEIVTSGGVDGDSLASLTIDQQGEHNALVFTANAAYSGAAGNQIQIQYIDAGGTVAATTAATTDLGGGNYRIDEP